MANIYELPWSNARIQAHHVAGMIAAGALLFLILVDWGFRGLRIDF